MKALFLFVLFGLSTSLSAIGQIEVKFSKPESNFYFEQVILNKDSTTRKTIDIEVNVISRVTQDYLIKINLENVTTKSGEVVLITEAFTLSKDELNKPGIIKRKIEFDVASVDSKAPSKVAKIFMEIEGVTFDSKNHERLLTISPMDADADETEDQKAKSIYLKQLMASDPMDIAVIKLILNENKTKYLIRENTFDKNKPVCNEKHDQEFEVDKVIVYFAEGRISRILVISEEINGHFETQYPISATSFDRNNNDFIFYHGSDSCMKRAVIPVGSILSYIGLSSRKRFPPDGEIILSSQKHSDTLRFSRNPVDFFDVRTYTDPLGLNGKANGLIQTEANAHFVANTHNWKYATLFPTVKIGIGWSKFDSEFDTLAFTSLLNRDANELLKIQQQSNLNLGLEIDLIKFSRVHDYSFSFGHHFSLTNLSDTSANFTRAITPSLFTSFQVTLYANPWIEFDLKFPLYMTYLHDNVFEEFSRKWDSYIVPELEMRIRPGNSKNSEKDSNVSIFARAKYFDMINSKGLNFLQLQTGISISLKDLFNK